MRINHPTSTLSWDGIDATSLNCSGNVLKQFKLPFAASNIFEIHDRPQNYFFAYTQETGEFTFFTFTLDWEPLIHKRGFIEHELTSLSVYGTIPTRLTAYSKISGHWYIWEVNNKELTQLKSSNWKSGWNHVEIVHHDSQDLLISYRDDSGAISISTMQGVDYDSVYEGYIEIGMTQMCIISSKDGLTITSYSDKSGSLICHNFDAKSLKSESQATFIAGCSLFKHQNKFLLFDKTQHVAHEISLDTNHGLTIVKHLKTLHHHILDHNVQPSLVLMSFNVWNSGSRVYDGLKTIAKVIIEHQADIIGLQEMGQEGMDALQKILGEKYHCNYYTGIVSKFKLKKIYQNINQIYVWGGLMELPNGLVIKVLNSHLTAYPYGPYFLRDSGFNVEKTICQCEETQGRDIIHGIEKFVFNEDHEQITVMFGDHNIPSHLDHTKETSMDVCLAKKRKLKIVHIQWPVSKKLYDVGFLDTFRSVYPDVSMNPGLTWTPGTPKGTFMKDEVHDRIDFVYTKSGREGNLLTVHTYTVDDIKNAFYPSDHAVVVSHVLLPKNNELKQ